jgi:hypothetical protein
MSEDFASYELAVKLKAKGFDGPCEMYYHIHDDIADCVGSLESTNGERNFVNSNNKYRCAALTISQVLKWLREEKKLHIELWTVGKKPIKWCHTITTLNHVGEKQGWASGTRGDSYEAAAIAGIEYVIDNLI